MEFLDVVRGRRTTNGPLSDRPVSAEHQQLLVEVAATAPSHFNSQPWRFVLVDERATIEAIAQISGQSMRSILEAGTFFTRYRRYFRFSEEEMEERRDGIFFDQLPRALRPFRRYVFSPRATKLMNSLSVPATLGSANRELVAGAPLILAALLDRSEYVPGELSGFYSVFALGAAIENIWLATVELGMGIQFISAPMEVPAAWHQIAELLDVPAELELMALYRIGYEAPGAARPPIDWTSRHRRRRSQYVFRNSCAHPVRDDPVAADGPLVEPTA